MKNFLKSLADVVFSFGMFMFLFATGCIFLMVSIINADERNREATRIATEACYSQGMVLVQSDAGQRCVLPQSLVKVK